MFARVLGLARAPVELTEAEVAVGDERAHAECAGEGQRPAVVAFCVLGAACRRDVTGEAEGVGFVCPRAQPAGKHQGLFCVACRFVEPPGGEIGRSSAEKSERRPALILATAGFLDAARHQRDRLVDAAGEGVGGAEGGGNEGNSGHDLRRSAEIESPLEDPDCAWQISPSHDGESETGQRPRQREGMIGRLCGAYGSLAVADGLVESAELGEDFGEVGRRQRRLDGGCPEALVAQVALERGVPFEQGDRLPKLAEGRVRHAQEGRGHHGRPIAEGSREGEGLLPKSDPLGVVAAVQALDHHERRDPRESVLVAERPRQHLRLAEVLPHARSLIEGKERVPEFEVNVDGQLGHLAALGEMTKGRERLLQAGGSLAVGGSPCSSQPRLSEIGNGFLP